MPNETIKEVLAAAVAALDAGQRASPEAKISAPMPVTRNFFSACIEQILVVCIVNMERPLVSHFSSIA